MSISQALRAAVTKAISNGWSMNSIAKASGVSCSSLSRWLADDRSLTLASAEALAQHFGIKLSKPSRNAKQRRR